MRLPTRALFAGLAALALLLAAAGTASAQTYTVSRTDDPVPGACESGDCSLREALMAANGTTSVDDVVVLPASATPYLIQYEELSLLISDEVEVRGAGADTTVVKGDGKEVVFTTSAKATLSGLTISGGDGGIQNGSSLTLRAVSLEDNERAAAGGGIQSNGPLTIESSFLGGNKTSGISGGAIQANAEVTILNSTLAGNSSMAASAINGNGSVLIAHSAVVANRSGGASSAAVRGSPLTVSNSVFFDNRNTEGLRGCTSFPSVTSPGGNVSDEATCGAGPEDRPNVDPRLGTLALHGGPTLVYDLLGGSPAIDFAVGTCLALDQRGIARPEGAACDSGPYEFVPAPPQPPPRDTEVALRLGRGKLILNKRGVIRVKLLCLPSEISPPCSGRVSLYRPAPSTGKVRALQTRKRFPLGGKKFAIAAGKKRTISVRPSRREVERVRTDPKARFAVIEVRAKDSAENRKTIRKIRRIRPL